MEADWDLFAVVRGCSAAGNTTPSWNSHQELTVPCLEDRFEPRIPNLYQELNGLYNNPFIITPQTVPYPQTLPISPLSVLTGLQDDCPLPSEQNLKKPFLSIQTEPKDKQQKPSSKGLKANNTTRSRKRKNNLKKVCHVTAENLSSDKWCWRKYGQKPIKGSPYPRGYYRCSTSKGCLARKQVEQNRSDPDMFILTYTGDHNHPVPTHRNSLAGTTRPKHHSASLLEPESSREEMEEKEGGSSGVTTTALDDDFFAGLEDFTAGEGGACRHFPAAVLFNWSWDSEVDLG